MQPENFIVTVLIHDKCSVPKNALFKNDIFKLALDIYRLWKAECATSYRRGF